MAHAHAQRQVPESRGTKRGNRALVLVDDPAGVARLRARKLRFWDRALARCYQLSLDARLAAGASPDGGSLLAVRARTLVSPVKRQQLARDWGRVMRTAGEPRSRRSAAPLCRDRIIAAEPAIHELQRSLLTSMPVPVRGVAIARQLLVDATGPVYNRRAPIDLRTAVLEAIRHMDPTTGLMPTQP